MIELTAVIFSLLSVYLTVKNKIASWPIGIVGIIFYAIYFHNIDVVGNMWLQLLFLLQSAYGWYNWKNTDRQINILDKIDKINVGIATFALFGILYFILSLVGSNFTFFDTITTTLSITAMFLLAKHKVDAWYYWILVDALYIVFFIHIGSWLSAVTFSIFFILAIIGLKQWKKNSFLYMK